MNEAMRAFEKALVEAGNSQPDLLNADFRDYGAAAEQAGQYVKATELFRKSIELVRQRRAVLQLSWLCGSSAAETGQFIYSSRLGDGAEQRRLYRQFGLVMF